MSEFFVAHKTVFVLIHAVVAAVALGVTLTTDFLFFQFLRDYKISRMESKLFISVSNLFPVLLGLAILSGLAIYLSDPERYITSSKFIIKMLAVFVVLCNGVFLHVYVSPRLQKLNFTHHKFEVTKRLAFAAGAISMTSWLSSYLLGSLPKIPFTIAEGLLLYACFVLVGIIASQIVYTVIKKTGAR